MDFELADYTGVIRRRLRIVIGAIAVCLIGTIGYFVTAPKSYTATAVVYVTPTAGSEGNQVAFSRTSGQGINLDTEAGLVTLGTVATIAQHMLHTSVSPAELSKLVKITAAVDSQVLNISCSDSTAAGLGRLRAGFGLAYLQNRSATAASSLSSRTHLLQGKITALEKTVATLKTWISGLQSILSALTGDQATVKFNTSQLHSLDRQLASLTTDLANTSGGPIVTGGLAARAS